MSTQQKPKQAAFTLEEGIANALLRAATKVGTESLAQYSAWLLGGIAAALAILLSNLDTLLRFVALSELRCTAIALVLALGLGVVTRYVGMVAASGTYSGASGNELSPDSSIEVDFEKVFNHVQQVTWQPARWILKRQLTKLREGGLLAANGFLFNAAQLHALLVFLDSLVVVVALGYLAWCLVA